MTRWWRFWFEPSDAVDLGVSRALFYAGVLVMYALEDFSAWGNVSPAFWMPMPLFETLGLAPLSSSALQIVEVTWRIALAMSAIGLFSRISMSVAAVLGIYLLGLPHNFGHVYHFDATLAIIMIVLACSRAGDAISIDAWRGRTQQRLSGEYTWPIRFVWVAMAFVFFAAGIAKLRYGGIEWVTSENMSILLTRAVYHVSDADPITGIGLWIAQRPFLASTLAGVSLVVELGFILTLFSRRARIVFVPGAFMMLVGIRVMMGPTFGGFLVANVFWVPWRAVLSRARERLTRLSSSAAPTYTPSRIQP